MNRAAIVVALRVERAALRGRTGKVTIIRTGIGPRKAARIQVPHGCVSAGLAGGLAPAVLPGDVVVASEVVVGDRRIPVPHAGELADRLRATGLRVHLGPMAASDHVVRGTERQALADRGCLAVDMESGALADLATGKPFAVARVVLDTPAHPLLRPGTPIRAVRALRTLRRAGPELTTWCSAETPAAAPKEVA